MVHLFRWYANRFVLGTENGFEVRLFHQNGKGVHTWKQMRRFWKQRPPKETMRTLDWGSMTNWLAEVEEYMPEGDYLRICTILKHLHRATTPAEQKTYMDELTITHQRFMDKVLSC